MFERGLRLYLSLPLRNASHCQCHLFINSSDLFNSLTDPKKILLSYFLQNNYLLFMTIYFSFQHVIRILEIFTKAKLQSKNNPKTKLYYTIDTLPRCQVQVAKRKMSTIQYPHSQNFRNITNKEISTDFLFRLLSILATISAEEIKCFIRTPHTQIVDVQVLHYKHKLLAVNCSRKVPCHVFPYLFFSQT